jgi:hypothetical protein
MILKFRACHAARWMQIRMENMVEADVVLADGGFGRAAVPSGASTGQKEAVDWERRRSLRADRLSGADRRPRPGVEFRHVDLLY